MAYFKGAEYRTVFPGRGTASGIPVFILTPHELVRQGLTEIFEGHGLKVVGVGGFAHEAATRITNSKPDVVILDEWLPDLTGIEACRDIRSRNPGVKCLLLTSFDDDRAVLTTALAGATGYVPKDLDSHRLMAGVQRAVFDDLVPDFDTNRRSVESMVLAPSGHFAVSLNDQEKRLLAHMAEGRTNLQISDLTHLSEKSVRHYISLALAKLGFQRDLWTTKIT